MTSWITLQPLTLYEILSLVVSFAGFAFVGLSLALMRRQTKAMHEQANAGVASMKSSAYLSYATQMFTIDTIFLQYPKLRQYFHSGREIDDTETDYDQIIAISELFLDYIDTVLIQEEQLPDLWPSNKWDLYFKEMFTNSPVLRSYLNSHRDWYTDKLINLMLEGKRPSGQLTSSQ